MASRTKRNSKTKEQKLQYSSYCIEIIEWGMPYRFSINKNKKLMRGPYWEHSCLKIQGKFIHPEKITGKDVEVYIIGQRDFISALNEPGKHDNLEPPCIGSLTVRGETRKYLGSLPIDIFPQISSMLSAGEYRFLDLHGKMLFRGSADIHSLCFEKEVELDQLM